MNKEYTLSLLTSSTTRPLSEIPEVFIAPQMADSVELYVARLTDQVTLGISTPEEKYRSPACLMSKLGYPQGRQLDDCRVGKLAKDIRKLIPGTKIKALTTYFPEITSADSGLRDDAINALEVAVRLADKLQVPWVECVGGRSDEECVWQCAEGDLEAYDCYQKYCRVVMSYKDYAHPHARKKIPVKAKWLISGLAEVHRRLADRPIASAVSLLLEMEPGPLFVLSRRHTLRYVLWQMTKYRTPNSDLPFVRLNCDIGHLAIMTHNQLIGPGKVWRQILRGLGQPSDFIGNFHVSWHPYGRVHLDHPPTADRRYRIPETTEEGFRGQWGVPKDLIPWLNCVLCVSEHRADPTLPANLSLELEAASRDELAVVGLRSIRNALEHLSEKRRANPAWVMRTCKSCPQSPKRI